jgi:hypothetical protein
LKQTPFIATARQGGPKLSVAGYLSMNAVAWLVSQSAPEREDAPLNLETTAPEARMIRYG